MANMSKLKERTRRFVMDREPQPADTHRGLHRTVQAFRAKIPSRRVTADPETRYPLRRDGKFLQPSRDRLLARSNRLKASGQNCRPVESSKLHPTADARSRNRHRASCALPQGPPTVAASA